MLNTTYGAFRYQLKYFSAFSAIWFSFWYT